MNNLKLIKTTTLICSLSSCFILGRFSHVVIPLDPQNEQGVLFENEAKASLNDLSLATQGKGAPEKADEVEESETQNSLLVSTLGYYETCSSEALSSEYEKLQAMPMAEQAWRIPLLFSCWADRDPESALKAMKDLSHMKDEMVSMALNRWVQQSPQDAASFYKGNERSLFTRNYEAPWAQVSGSELVARALAQENPENSIQWAQELGDPADKMHALKSIFGYLTDNEPNLALNAIEKLSDNEQEHARLAIAEMWSKNDIEGAIAWINTLDDYTFDKTVPVMVKSLAQENPEQATEYLEYIRGNRDSAIGAIVDAWVDTNPKQAADWLFVEADAGEQRAFMRPIFEEWISHDSDGAKGWMQSQESGPSKDIAAEAYIRATAHVVEDPLLLVNLAKSEIADVTKRESVIASVLATWAKVDPVVSKGIVEELGLSLEALSQYHQEVDSYMVVE